MHDDVKLQRDVMCQEQEAIQCQEDISERVFDGLSAALERGRTFSRFTPVEWRQGKHWPDTIKLFERGYFREKRTLLIVVDGHSRQLFAMWGESEERTIARIYGDAKRDSEPGGYLQLLQEIEVRVERAAF